MAQHHGIALFFVVTGALHNALRGGHFVCQTAQSGRIGVGHITEARAEARIVGAGERVGAHKIDVVVNDHQVAHLEIEVHAAAGICHQQRFHTQRFHHTDGRGDVGHGMSLIKMKTPLHAHDAVPGQTAQHKTSRVPRRGGNGKAGNGGVFHKRRILQHIGQTAQPAAQDQAHRRACAGHGADGIYRVLDHFLQGFSSVRVWLLFSSK